VIQDKSDLGAEVIQTPDVLPVLLVHLSLRGGVNLDDMMEDTVFVQVLHCGAGHAIGLQVAIKIVSVTTISDGYDDIKWIHSRRCYSRCRP
jgi:hypothetical protein